MLEARRSRWVVREELKRAFPSIAFGISGDKTLAFHVGLPGENKDLQRLLHAREYIRTRVGLSFRDAFADTSRLLEDDSQRLS